MSSGSEKSAPVCSWTTKLPSPELVAVRMPPLPEYRKTPSPDPAPFRYGAEATGEIVIDHEASALTCPSQTKVSGRSPNKSDRKIDVTFLVVNALLVERFVSETNRSTKTT